MFNAATTELLTFAGQYPGPAIQSPDFTPDDSQLTFDHLCPSWSTVGECPNYHLVAKEIFCNREWCQGGCGGEHGPAHQRRKASWLPKARQIDWMGRWVFTLPPEVRANYRTKPDLGKLGTAVTEMMKRHGWLRGLRRYHWFGEPDDWLEKGEYPPYHPHFEVLVDGGHLPIEKIEAVKHSWANILKVPYERINAYYEFVRPGDVRTKLHRVAYALRPTFLDWKWDVELAEELAGFKNAVAWGGKARWSGEPCWDIPVNPDAPVPSPAVQSLEAGRCPECSEPIRWLGVFQSMGWRQKIPDGWLNLGEGYYQGPS